MKGAARVVDLLGRNPTTGEVYWFLWDEYDLIIERTEGRRMSWKTLLPQIQALGLKNAHGNPLDNIRTLQSTFDTVRRDKQRLTEARKQSAAVNRRLTNDPPPVVARTVAPVLLRTGTSPAAPRTPDEQNAWILNELKNRSGKRGR